MVANAAFYIMLRMNRGKIIKAFQDYLCQHPLEEMKALIKKGEIPPFKPEWIAGAVEFKDGIKQIKFEKVCEFISEASPELFDYINSLGYEGGMYLAKLWVYFIDLLDHPEKIQMIAQENAVPMLKLTCDKCRKSWPVPEDQADKVEKCPFCGEKA